MPVVNRVDLIESVRTLLARAGFAVSERCDVRPISFDLLARRDGQLLIVKVFGNVDALMEQVAQELRTLAQFLKGTPLIVGLRSSPGALEDGVVYTHRGVPVVTLATLSDYFLENQSPLAFASPGGLHVALRGELLRGLRQERGLSLGLLAQVAGVSRRAIQMYEEGMRATIDAALRLEEYLQVPLVRPIEPAEVYQPDTRTGFEPELSEKFFGSLEQEIFRMLRGVGFRVVPTGRSPFSAVSQEKQETILTGVDRGDAVLERRATILSSLTAVSEKDGMIIVERELRFQNLRGTPLVSRQELQRLRDPRDLVTLLEERR